MMPVSSAFLPIQMPVSMDGAHLNEPVRWPCPQLQPHLTVLRLMASTSIGYLGAIVQRASDREGTDSEQGSYFRGLISLAENELEDELILPSWVWGAPLQGILQKEQVASLDLPLPKPILAWSEQI